MHCLCADGAGTERCAGKLTRMCCRHPALAQWGRLHSLRTALGAVALGASLYGAHSLLTSK